MSYSREVMRTLVCAVHTRSSRSSGRPNLDHGRNFPLTRCVPCGRDLERANAQNVGVAVSQPYTAPGPLPGQPGGTKGKTTVILSVVVVVLVIAAGLFVTLFLVEKGAVNDANNNVSVTEQQIADQKKQLSDAKSEVDDLDQQGKDLQSTHDQLQTCADSAKAAIQAGQTGTDEELQDAVDQMLTDCQR